MATTRYSLNPGDKDYQTVQAAGAAVVTKNIELTVDTTALAAAGLSSVMIRRAIIEALAQFEAFIETSGKFSLPG